MSTDESEATIEQTISSNTESDLDPESEKGLDSEKYSQLSEVEQGDIRPNAEKGDFLDIAPELQKQKRNSDPEKGNGYKCVRETADLKTDSEDSDLESECSQKGSDVFDRLNEVHASCCGDGVVESVMPNYEESPTKAVRRFRGLLGTGSTFKVSPMDGCRWYAKNGMPDHKISDQAGSKMAARNNPNDGTSTLKAWFKYIAPKTMCLIILSLVYLGFTLFGIKVLIFTPNSV